MMRIVFAVVVVAICATTAVSGQRRAFDLTTPRPIAAADTVWIEELTWMEIRDAMKAGKTTALIVAGSTEQNGPYVPTGKHVFVLRATAEAVARKLGHALVAPAIPFEPGNFSTTPGTIQVRDTTYDALVEDQAESLRANGFKHIILIGDSGGNQRGLERVARKLSAARVVFLDALVVPHTFDGDPVFGASQLVRQPVELLVRFQVGILLDDDEQSRERRALLVGGGDSIGRCLRAGQLRARLCNPLKHFLLV